MKSTLFTGWPSETLETTIRDVKESGPTLDLV